jgi:hypothetical protein
MAPWIWPGGKLGVQRSPASELRLGDIAVWFDGRRLRSHRVVALDDAGRFVTRGDLGDRDDTPADGKQLLGRAVCFTIYGVGYRLDRGLPNLAARLIAETRWLTAVVAHSYSRLCWVRLQIRQIRNLGGARG